MLTTLLFRGGGGVPAVEPTRVIKNPTHVARLGRMMNRIIGPIMIMLGF